MNRRTFVTGLGAVLAAPLAAEAQQAGRNYRIGFLSTQALSTLNIPLAAFKEKLRDLGYVEGRNLAIEYRWAGGKYERLSALARELVHLKVDLLVTPDGVPPALAAKAATKTIPIVVFAGDAVESGLVSSLPRPGGNVTGVSGLTAGLDAKRLEILKEAVPTITRVAILWNPENLTGVPQRNRMALAAETLRVEPRMLEARSPREIDDAFAVAGRERLDGLLVLADPMLTSQRKRIVDLAARARLPVAGMFRTFAETGALISYGPDLVEINRQLAVYAAKILNGAKPGDLPVEEPTRYELVINLKTAKALGLTIPPSLLLRADQLIE
jgi:putative ABC transport system substrate-binding protein